MVKYAGGALISLLAAEKLANDNDKEYDRDNAPNIPLPKVNARPLVVASSEGNEEESGICKQKLPYFPKDHQIKEEWMYKAKISGKDKAMLLGKGLYGVNPVEVDAEGDILRVHTELPGGDNAARECFKNLTGVKVPELVDKRFIVTKLDGTKVTYRPYDHARSKHPKVEINGKKLTKLYEKITFK